jgi:hypothetical protein
MKSADIPQVYQRDFDLTICATCGAQYSQTIAGPPEGCKICLDERQFVPPSGQKWTSLRELHNQGIKSSLMPSEHDSRVLRVMNDPGVGISQTRKYALRNAESIRK